MEIISNHLYVVDRITNTVTRVLFTESAPLKEYVMSVLQKSISSVGDREYNFKLGYISMQTYLNKIVAQEELEVTTQAIAQKLLTVEIESQEEIDHLGREIPKGMLIISYVDMEVTDRNERKIIISKADYDEFIEQMSGELKVGLATRKKLYKAFVADINLNDITKLITYDSTSRIATYWWSDFLELDVVRKNNVNTKNAFDAIHSEILKPVEKNYKQDYLHLWNITLGYFKLNGEFNLDYYVSQILGNYTPYDELLNISDLMVKCNRLPEKLAEKNKFDRRFIKDYSSLKGKKYKQIVKLSNEIELVVKDYVANLSEIMQAHYNEETNEKYLMIKSDSGYEYAKNLSLHQNE
jgi:hypothetical protein